MPNPTVGTLRVTIYRDSTLISTSNNLSALATVQTGTASLFIQQATAGLQRCLRPRSHEQETRAILRPHIRTQTHRKAHRQSHVYTALAFQQAGALGRRSLYASLAFGSAGEWSDHSRVRKTPVDGYRKWAGTELAMDGYESHYTV